MLKYPDEWAFVSLYDGLGGPPIFCGLLVEMITDRDNTPHQ
jgi:hypothetical protein